MKKCVSLFSFILSLLASISLNAQNDVIVTINNEKISGITITGHPEKIVSFSVNVYNDNLQPSYEDMKIFYTAPGVKKTQDILYNQVESYIVGGKTYKTWHSRKIPFIDGAIVFDTIMEVPGKSKEELYNLVRSWLTTSFSLTADGIQKLLVEDKEGGAISIKRMVDGSVEVKPYKSPTFSSFIYYDLLVRVKDNKARLTVSNIFLHYEKGAIFNDAAIFKYDLKAENFATSWRSGKTIKSHQYRGVNMMFYCIEDKMFTSFSKMLNAKEEEW